MGTKWRTDKRICLNCNSTTTRINNKGYEQWLHHKDGFICKKCYDKLIGNPKGHAKWSPRQLQWTPKHKQILLKQNPRKGICSNCGKEGKTTIHHREYHVDDPLKDTIELCRPCHLKEDWKLGKFDNRPKQPLFRDSHGRFTHNYNSQ